MSIILKGIDLPKKGEALSLFMMADGQVIITHIKDSRIWEYSEAEAIQIPKDHGRLIDGDELKANYTEDDDVYTPWLRADIDDAPTILEEEK